VDGYETKTATIVFLKSTYEVFDSDSSLRDESEFEMGSTNAAALGCLQGRRACAAR
jgi:hypothetical protein